jgi:hypothetical protein
MKTASPKIPKEYEAFKALLRQVVKTEPKPASAPASSDKG